MKRAADKLRAVLYAGSESPKHEEDNRLLPGRVWRNSRSFPARGDHPPEQGCLTLSAARLRQLDPHPGDGRLIRPRERMSRSRPGGRIRRHSANLGIRTDGRTYRSPYPQCAEYDGFQEAISFP